MRFVRVLSLVGLLAAMAFGQAANHVVISEVGPMGGGSTTYNTGEFVELYNPLPSDVTFGANVALVSGNTTGTNAAEWQITLSGRVIKAYGFLLIGDGAVTGADVNFPASKNLANSGTRSCVQLRDGANVIDAFGWDPASTPNLSQEGSSFRPSSTSGAKSFERKSGPLVTGPDNLGNAWDSGNNSTDFFENAQAAMNPQKSTSAIEVHPYQTGPAGPGIVTMAPARWKFNVPTEITFTVKPGVNDTIRGVMMPMPPQWYWSGYDFSFQPNTGVKVSLPDTIIYNQILLSGNDSLVVKISGVMARDTTMELVFNFSTSANGTSYAPVAALPKTLSYGSPRPISWVKAKQANGVHTLLGQWGVVRGTVTVAGEFGGPSYLQDASAGMALFDSSVSNNVQRGDEIVVLGKIAPFNDLFEFAPAVLLNRVAEGVQFDTMVVTVAQLLGQTMTAVEPYEARLIRINGITSVTNTTGTPATAWTTTGSGTNYKITDATGTIEIRISSRINLANLPTPIGTFDVVGALSQFNTFYQIQPRSVDDVIPEGNGPRFSSAPTLTSITPTGLTFTWNTDVPGSSIINYGATTAYGQSFSDTNKVMTHTVTLTALKPAAIYQMQFGSANAGGITYTGNAIHSTASQSSTGTVNVWFNKSVNTTFARGELAQSLGSALYQKAVSRINSAVYSVDVALYSLSGTVGATIANALVSAKQRGVKVRVIGEKDNQTTAPWTTLKNNGVTVVDDSYDATNGGLGLMHNKFFVFDNRDSTSDTDDWLIAGSWNATDPGTNDDAQNIVEIQDKALANAYTVEFNEMWGSETDVPNAAASRFGARKLDNTPHQFVIGGVPVEQYFSPSDRTTGRIIATLGKAVSSINVALLTFTRNDIANVLIARKKAGLGVHGVLDNRTDQGSVFDTLLASGVDVHLKAGTGLLHHKYGIVDADRNQGPQYTITGSHNWSSAAENSNNENTLIFTSSRVANLYLQEFSARYTEAGGTMPLVGVAESPGTVPSEFGLSQNFPNPFNPSTAISYQLSVVSDVRLSVFDLLGREVMTLVQGEKPAGRYTVTFDASRLTSGVYFYTLRAGGFVETKKMVLMK